MGNEPRRSGVDGAQSAEETNEVPQDLRILRQLGDYAATQLVVNNPFFQQFSQGELGPEQRLMLREQLEFVVSHIRKMAAVGIEEAGKGNDMETSVVLQQIRYYLFRDVPKSGTATVHPATQSFLQSIDDLAGSGNYILIAAAVYALVRMAPFERLLTAKSDNPVAVRNGVRKELRSKVPTDVSGELKTLMGTGEYLEEHLKDNLEHAITMYVTARYTFQEGILKGIDIITEAKRKFYRDLPSDISRNDETEEQNVHLSAGQP